MAEAEHYNHRIKQLSDRAAASRHSLAHAGRSLKASANVSRRVQTSIRGNLTTWLGSAALMGLVLAKLPARKKKVYVNSKTGETKKAKKGLFVAALGIAFQLVRPYLQKFLVEQAKVLAQKHLQQQSFAARE